MGWAMEGLDHIKAAVRSGVVWVEGLKTNATGANSDVSCRETRPGEVKE